MAAAPVRTFFIISCFLTLALGFGFTDSGAESLDYDVRIVELEDTLYGQARELHGWMDRIRTLEGLMVHVTSEKSDVLRRRRRNLPDPRLGLFVGKLGPPGPSGPQGVPGKIGARGHKGNKGLAGAPGLRGPQGSYGHPGWRGPPGFLGHTGENGEKGFQGYTGIPGLRGDVGWVGENGQHGYRGPPGEYGDVGFIGMPGPPGLGGDVGEIGFIGPPGHMGSTGLPGPVGEYGGPGETGERGFEGPEGPRGPKGDKGGRGDVGDLGPWGPVGAPGPMYDPYAAMFGPAHFLEGPPVGTKCNDTDDGEPNCSSFNDGPPAIGARKVSVPVYRHPPPGAQVLPVDAMPMLGKATYVHAPPPGPKVAAYYPADMVRYVRYDEEEKDILTEAEYLQMIKEYEQKQAAAALAVEGANEINEHSEENGDLNGSNSTPSGLNVTKSEQSDERSESEDLSASEVAEEAGDDASESDSEDGENGEGDVSVDVETTATSNGGDFDEYYDE